MPSMITHVMKVTMSVSLSAYRQDSAAEIAGIVDFRVELSHK
jgi:hypothetical protein